MLRSSNCRNCIGIMIGCPHLLQGTVPNGGKSPGMKTFVSHQLQVTMRRGLSLMPEANLPPLSQPTSLEKQDLPCQKLFDKHPKMVFLSAVENENHVCSNAEARAGQGLHVHLAA
jgi:hypothetical protein